MRRRRHDEHVSQFRQRKAGPVGKAIGQRLAGWAEACGADVGRAEPELPAWLSDRPADVWEPLIAIADAAGGVWPAWAREAAGAIEANRRTVDVSLGIRLLTDIHTVFAADDKLATVTLLERLNALDEAPWGNLRGKPLDARGLARRLSRYDVRPKSVRLADDVAKGYERSDFEDVWGRYLSLAHTSVTSVTSVTTDEPSATDVTDVTDPRGRQT
jgi:hypothetical protein